MAKSEIPAQGPIIRPVVQVTVALPNLENRLASSGLVPLERNVRW